MKKVYFIISAVFVMGIQTLNAQSLYDVNHVMGTDLNGTARYIGMGGAMGALGGDITTTSTNPAGIGLFRSNDAMMTFGLSTTKVTSDFPGTSNSATKTIPTFDNIGVVFANKTNNSSSLKFLNFALAYHRTKSFNRNMIMGGNYGASQMEEIAGLTSADPQDLKDMSVYANNYNVGWLSVMAFNAYLINPVYTTQNGKSVFANYYNPYYTFTDQDQHSVDGTYKSWERGGVDNFDFNMAFNISDRFYFGATLGFYNIDYDNHSAYTEAFWPDNTTLINDGYYTLENRYNVDGSGVDFKLGFILRPIEESPFRIGLAIHTPTYYYITEHQKAQIDYVNIKSGSDLKSGISSPYDPDNNDMESEIKYHIVTPWKYNFSMGYTFGQSAAIGIEYELADYSSAKLKDDNNDNMVSENSFTKNMLKSVGTLKIGAEYKLYPELAFRLGYNYIGASTNDNAYKQMPTNSVRTDTEYLNTKSVQNFSAGVGFHTGPFYWDVAYVYTKRNADFYPFYLTDNNSSANVMAKTKVSDSTNRFVCTLGFRF